MSIISRRQNIFYIKFLQAYSAYALRSPSDCVVVAIAEPRKQTRLNFAADHAHSIDENLIFEKWEDLAAATKAKGSKLVDAVIIAIQDQLHKSAVLAFAELGYDILCEKPMATSVQDCLQIHDAVVKAGIIFGMGHGKLRPQDLTVSEE